MHSNHKIEDQHKGLHVGTIPIKELLHGIESLCPDATITLEMTQTKPSLDWRMKERIWNF